MLLQVVIRQGEPSLFNIGLTLLGLYLTIMADTSTFNITPLAADGLCRQNELSPKIIFLSQMSSYMSDSLEWLPPYFHWDRANLDTLTLYRDASPVFRANEHYDYFKDWVMSSSYPSIAPGLEVAIFNHESAKVKPRPPRHESDSIQHISAFTSTSNQHNTQCQQYHCHPKTSLDLQVCLCHYLTKRSLLTGCYIIAPPTKPDS